MTDEDLRPLMLSIAYRMVGSFSEAEDIVQEAFMRLAHPRTVQSPKAWLTTVTTRPASTTCARRACGASSTSARGCPSRCCRPGARRRRARREAETLSLAFLVVLESLSPVERAVFLLREVFDYGYGEIAEIVGKSEDNCRQLAVRARRHVDARRPRFEPSREQREELARRFFAAVEEGETEPLVELLAADVAFYGDGGGKAPAIGKPLFGRDRVASLLLGFSRVAARQGATVQRVEVNGQPGALALNADGSLIAVMALDIVDGDDRRDPARSRTPTRSLTSRARSCRACRRT